MAEMKNLAESFGYFDAMDELRDITKKAAMQVANELGYSQKCKDEINKCETSEDVDKVMKNERRKLNDGTSIQTQ